MIKPNVMIDTDSYKSTHYKQYPPKTTNIYSYFESRGGDHHETVLFGLQAIIKEFFQGQVVTKKLIEEADDFWTRHIGPNTFNKEGWEYILKKHGGRLPIRIKAVPEGMPIPLKNALITMENTDPRVPWLTNWLETTLVRVWYPTTIATNSRAIREDIHQAMLKTSDEYEANYSLGDFKCHDFGFRGVSTFEESAYGGAAHLVSFSGTDTTSAIRFIWEYYNSSNTKEMFGFSIPAAEHSTITSWGKEHEVDAFRNMLVQYPTGLVAVVSDSYDIFNACANLWGQELRSQVLNRDGVLIIRPDSGDPVEVVKKVLITLWYKFDEGRTINSKGYKVLDPHVRIIQGDGIDRKMLNSIMDAMIAEKFSIDNIAFGSGGGLLRKFDRDTFKFAFKASSAVVDGEEREVFKSPITSYGKGSKKGRLMVVNETTIHTVSEGSSDKSDILRTVFENGELMIDEEFSHIKNRAKII